MRHDVLLIEDDPETRDVMAEILRELGYAVATAGNGLLAMEYLSSHEPPRLVLLDLMMPHMNGWEFREAQLADARFAAIPVVVVSADREIEKEAHSLGVDVAVKKPVELRSLIEAVRRYVMPVAAA